MSIENWPPALLREQTAGTLRLFDTDCGGLYDGVYIVTGLEVQALDTTGRDHRGDDSRRSINFHFRNHFTKDDTFNLTFQMITNTGFHFSSPTG
ncbi:hypothetical protein SBDP1_1520028 [Syntrophobacter sp. SbD1]|nr:hypothetical protein SBDP1_1520028 [Syntrophobacter sp. SbD1]